ncbi:MAG: YbaK/EbsC family protein [Bdellovibrionales bacterium]
MVDAEDNSLHKQIRDIIEEIAYPILFSYPKGLNQMVNENYSIESAAITHLVELGMQFDVIKHPDGIRSAAELAEHIGVPVAQIPKTLLLEIKNKGYLVCVLGSDRKVDTKVIAKNMGGWNISMAPRDAISKITGFQLGTVSPFGLSKSLTIILDESLLDLPKVYLGCGVKGYDIGVDVHELIRALQPRILPCGK